MNNAGFKLGACRSNEGLRIRIVISTAMVYGKTLYGASGGQIDLNLCDA
jgi:hypothetical protein